MFTHRISFRDNKINRKYPDVLLHEGSISEDNWSEFCNRIDEAVVCKQQITKFVFASFYLLLPLCAVVFLFKNFLHVSFVIQTTVIVIVAALLGGTYIVYYVIPSFRTWIQPKKTCASLTRVCEDMSRQFPNVQFKYVVIYTTHGSGDDQSTTSEQFVDIIFAHFDTAVQRPHSTGIAQSYAEAAVVSNANDNNVTSNSDSIFSSLESGLASSTAKKSILDRLSELDAIKASLTPKEYRETRGRILSDQ